MRLCFFSDLKLHYEARFPLPQWQRGVLQTFTGVDRSRALVVGNSPNYALNLDVVCFWAPESDYSARGFRAREMAMADALIARSAKAYPVVWVEDSTRSKTVGSIAGSVVTCTSHGYSNGDRVLIRRAAGGVDLYSVCPVSSVTTNTFVASGATHAIQAGDEIHLAEKVWYSMFFRDMSPLRPTQGGNYYAEEASYSFSGNGVATYSRTTVTL